MDVSLSELREMVMDREAWHAAIHGVAKSWTRLRDFPGGPVAMTLCSRCRVPASIPHVQLKILHATTKSWHSQIKLILKRERNYEFKLYYLLGVH